MLSKEELEEMYWGQGMTMPQIAEEIGVYSSTIYDWMKKYDVRIRTRSEAKLKGVYKLSKEKLDQMYWGQGMSQREIAIEVGVCQRTVDNWMKEHEIGSRTLSESLLKGARKPSKEELEDMYRSQEMSQSEIAIEVGVSCVTIDRWMKEHEIESRTPSEVKLINSLNPSKEELEEMYYNQEMSQPEIANVIGVHFNTVNKWMKDHEIESRSGNWKGGISFEPYCNKFNNSFKEAVRERDDYTCQLCRCEQSIGGQKLDVHHIHYDKANCYPDVVALCRSCNGKVNSNRDYWEQYFEEQLLYRGLLNWRIN